MMSGLFGACLFMYGMPIRRKGLYGFVIFLIVCMAGVFWLTDGKLEAVEQAKKDMGSMLDYIDKLNELDTSGVEPMSHVFPVNNVFREDVVTNGDGHDDTLANAPCAKDDGFKVPKTIG